MERERQQNDSLVNGYTQGATLCRCGTPQHGPSSNKMALMTSDFWYNVLPEYQMALTTSGFCALQTHPNASVGNHGRHYWSTDRGTSWASVAGAGTSQYTHQT